MNVILLCAGLFLLLTLNLWINLIMHCFCSRCGAQSRQIPGQPCVESVGLWWSGSFHGELLCITAGQHIQECRSPDIRVRCRISRARQRHALLSELSGGNSPKQSGSKDLLSGSQNGSCTGRPARRNIQGERGGFEETESTARVHVFQN